MSSDATHGQFVWYDLMSADPDRSFRFFSELFGWTKHEVPSGPTGTYTLLRSGGDDLGGIVPLEGDEIPSHWIGYVNVPDIDRSVAAVKPAGGMTCVPVTEIPNVGRFAVVTDPTGAILSPFQGSNVRPGEWPSPAKNPPGRFCWNELLTTDVAKAKSFYGSVLGWSFHALEMGPAGTYWVIQRGGVDEGGIMEKPKDAPGPSQWLHYVAVDDVDGTAARVTTLGGRIWAEPRDIPNIGRFAVAADPAGAMFALYKRAE